MKTTPAVPLLFAASFLLSAAALAADSAATLRLQVDLAAKGKAISPDLVGVFFEDLNYAADGGLYAELLQNRSFEYSATEQSNWGPFFGWDLIKTGDGDGQLGLGDARPVHVNNPHYLLLTVLTAGEGVGIANAGFDQLPVEAGKGYEASFWAYQPFMGLKWGGPGPRADQSKPMPVTLQLQSKDGRVLAESRLAVSGRAWTKYSVVLTPNQSAAEARFVLLAHEQGGLALDMVSLFPRDTFKGRANGLRRDLAQVIADIRPKFMRFPGGCLVHGSGVRAYYDWKASVGPVEQRRAQRNLWGYHQTLGMGYFEFFQYCEDIGAKPLPVVTAGVCCQHAGDSPGRGQEGLPLEEMPAYIQDVLDLIEWANGPADSKWGAVRAAAGHPAPFGLKYLGVGNEDAITPIFKERFQMILDVLKAKHPEIVVVGTSGPFHSGEDYDNGWALVRELGVPMVDEHYYVSPQWFWDNLARYESYDRKGAKVYVGEYAAHDQPKTRSTLRSALAEAAGLTSFERNGDVVQFASYAPLLARRGHTQWHPNMIYFAANAVYPTINYQVQRLFGHNSGDNLLPAALEGVPAGVRLTSSVVRDSASGDVIIKVVNGEDRSFSATVSFASASAGERRLMATVLTGANADVANEDGQPPAAAPVTDESKVGASFAREFPANSLTVLRLRQ
ncbi:MAG: alpha-N-arabinofuranosidase [Opitutaceae bacterium]|nr:alpha-N-arabinofuranosidase [Opitutaceae bacterium]